MRDLDSSRSMRWLGVMALMGTLTVGRAAVGGSLVTNLTQANLEAALSVSGMVLFGCDGTLTLTSPITIPQKAFLIANGHSVTISGGGSTRLFQVNPDALLSVQGLCLADGRNVGPAGDNGDPGFPGGDGFGAGILNQGGTVELTDCVLTNHFVQGGDGGLGVLNGQSSPAPGGNGRGAAICNLGGTVSLTNCILAGNTAQGGQGAASIGAVGYAGNAGGVFGGAIYSSGGAVNLEKVTLTANSAVGGTATTGAGNGNTQGGNAVGGALYATNAAVFIENSSFASNQAVGGGDPTVFWAPTGQVTGSGFGGAMALGSQASAEILMTTFTNNVAEGGAGYENAPSGSGFGGALFNNAQAQLTQSTFTGNQSIGGSSFGPGSGQGGAVYSTSVLAVDQCLFNLNIATAGAVATGATSVFPGSAAEGGGVWTSGAFTATNSTWTANRATGSAAGGAGTTPVGLGGNGFGGAVSVTGGTAVFVNITIAANETDGGASDPASAPSGLALGGGVFATNAVILVRNSIIANNPLGGDVWGVLTDGGYNLCSDGTAEFTATGSLNQVDPLLGVLADNGGPTATMALLAGSPAKDVIPVVFPPVDQRGVTRPQGSAADIGAFEVQEASAPPTLVTQPEGGTVRAGANLTFSVVASGSGSLDYQWLKDGVPLIGATTATLTLTNLQAPDAGTYTVAVTNLAGLTLSQGAVLIVDSTPVILSQPSSVVVAVGDSATFAVTADGPALAYQWRQNGLLLPGSTSPTLGIASALAGSQGAYSVVISNFAGMVTSAPALLSFDSSALRILVPPADQTVEAGYPAAFDVVVIGVPPFAYQWLFNGAVVPGATNSTLSLPCASTNDAGGYLVIVTNAYCVAASSQANLTVTPAAVPPNVALALAGSSLTLTFAAEAGRSYRLLYSTDLAVWSPVATNSAPSAGPLQFVRPSSSGPRAYYRVVTP